MSIHRTKHVLFALLVLLTACAKQEQAGSPTSAQPSYTETAPPPIDLPAEIPSADPSTPTVTVPTQDPTLFGSIGLNEIQAFALEPVVSEIFTRAMNGFLADDRVLDYQVVRVTVFPGSGGLLAEITYNVRTIDPAWLADGGTPAADDWINDKCSRFDLVTTETEYQLKNRRLCN